MTNEKAEITYASPKKPKFEQLRADHELFLQAFEKPTQIYRFLRTRHAIAPVFLHRTLYYLKHRRTRSSKKKREKFKVDNILEKVEEKQKKEEEGQQEETDELNGFLNLTFSGFFHGPVNGDLGPRKGIPKDDFVKVDAILVKVCHKRRKDVNFPIVQVPLGSGRAPYNPRTQLLPMTSSASISIPSSSFAQNSKTVKSHILMLQVTVTNSSSAGEEDSSNYMFQSESSPLTEQPDEPETKRRRLEKQASNGSSDSMTNLEEEKPADENKPPDSAPSVNHESVSESTVIYTAELIVFDNHKKCLLTDGDYELALQEKIDRKAHGKKKALSAKQSSWETVYEGKIGPFEVFAYGPTLKFKLQWAGSPVIHQHRSSVLSVPSEISSDSDTVSNCCDKDIKKTKRIFYQFIYNNSTQQQTEVRDDYCCPWCSLNCVKLYSLLKHLKCSHGRFIFTYAPHSKGARIDVCVNENYDGSYSGKAEEINETVGYAFSRDGPCRRTPFSQSLVCRPQRGKETLSEFLEPDEDADGVRPFYNGHNRIYFHSGSNQPMRPNEGLADSEDEFDPPWLRLKTQYMIDEFTDVNDGEKELMKLWNLHCMKHNFIADVQIPRACTSFIQERGHEILAKNLSRNFLLHLINLSDFGLLVGPQVLQAMRQLDDMKDLNTVD